MSFTESRIIELDVIDSTNNYAMQLIDGNKAHPGLTIVANRQTQGKGQRGRTWVDTPGESLLMSVIVAPRHALTEQFMFNSAVAVAIVNELQDLLPHTAISIKWPNDIIINDKKAGGILIENVLRGSSWAFSVIGLGLNLTQNSFPEHLPHATSLKMVSGIDTDRNFMLNRLREVIFYAASFPDRNAGLTTYNERLFRKGKKQLIIEDGVAHEVTVLHANADGTLSVQLQNGAIKNYSHGQITWEYGQ